MIKLRKGNTVVLGISDENVSRLKKDQPIKVNLKDLGMEDIVVYIVHGETEQKLYEMFKDQINPFKTIITDDNAPNN